MISGGCAVCVLSESQVPSVASRGTSRGAPSRMAPLGVILAALGAEFDFASTAVLGRVYHTAVFHIRPIFNVAFLFFVNVLITSIYFHAVN